MKIIVCVKQIRHIYTRTGQDPENRYLNPEDSIFRINPYDEAALELALRLKDAHEAAEIRLLSLGPLIAETELRRCLAVGAHHLHRIIEPNAEGNAVPLWQPGPWTKARQLASAIKELGAELVLCGKESTDRGSGQVGALLAHLLKYSYVSAITELSAEHPAGPLRVQRSAGRGIREILQCALPAVCSVDLGPCLRLPVHSRMQWAMTHHPIHERIHAPSRQTSGGMVTTRIFPPRPRTKIVPVPDSRLPAYERILQLLSGSKVEKKGDMLTGSLESQVNGIIDYLKANGFVDASSP